MRLRRKVSARISRPRRYESAALEHSYRSHRFWRSFASLALVLALGIVVPSFVGYGPLASQSHTRTIYLGTTQRDSNVNRQRTRYLQARTTSEAMRSIALLASLLPQTNSKEAIKLFAALLRGSGVPFLKHFSGVLGDALARRLLGSNRKRVDLNVLLRVIAAPSQERLYGAGLPIAFMWFRQIWARGDRRAFEREAFRHGSNVIKIYGLHKAVRQVLGIAF